MNHKKTTRMSFILIMCVLSLLKCSDLIDFEIEFNVIAGSWPGLEFPDSFSLYIHDGFWCVLRLFIKL